MPAFNDVHGIYLAAESSLQLVFIIFICELFPAHHDLIIAVDHKNINKSFGTELSCRLILNQREPIER